MKTRFANTEIVESVSACPGKVDRENNVIRGVKILGRHSVNNREYTTPAMEEAAKHYEGMRVNIDHPTKAAVKASRGTLEQWGWLESVQVRDDGVYGDLHYLKSHPHTETLLELAERRPDNIGLSHNADCSGFTEGRKQFVESVPKVRSVDVVQRPATNQSLFEHIEDEDMLKKTLKQLLESAPESTRGRKQLLAVLEMDGMADMGTTPVAVDPEESAEDQIWAGFRSAILAILDDDSLDIKTTRDQIMKVLDSYSSAFEAGSSDASEDTSATSGATTEGVDELRREVKLLRSEGKARDALEQANIQATPGRVKGVMSVLESSSDLKDLLDSFPKRSSTSSTTTTDTPRRSEKPRRSTPLTEGQDDVAQQSALPYKDRKEMARMIR